MLRLINKLLFVAAFMLPAAVAHAEPGQVALVGDVKLEQVVKEGDSTRVALVEPKVVVPGDRLVFTTSYTNSGSSAVTNFVVTNPLPGAVSLAPEAVPGGSFSVDGGKTWGALEGLTVADGQGGRRGAVYTDVTHIRWTIPVIAAGASGRVKYHAIVR